MMSFGLVPEMDLFCTEPVWENHDSSPLKQSPTHMCCDSPFLSKDLSLAISFSKVKVNESWNMNVLFIHESTSMFAER